MPCYRCGAREADPGRGSRLWVRAVRADIQVLVCPDCQQTPSWSTDVDHCPTCKGTNLVRRLGQTVCRTCESSATAEFLAVETTMDRGIAVGAGGRHRRIDDGRDLQAEVATAIDRVLGRHAKRDPSDKERPVSPPLNDSVTRGAAAARRERQGQAEPTPTTRPRSTGNVEDTQPGVNR